MKEFDVVTFGSAVIDNFVYTDVSTRGNELHYPIGSKILIDKLKFDVGGGGTNTAVAFSRLGLKTGCICAVGEDNNGKTILELLKKEKVEMLGPIKKKEITGYSVILDSHDKDRTILTYKGANNEIGINEIKKFKTKWLYFSSLLGKSFKTQEELAKKMFKTGTKIAINPSSYHIKEGKLTNLLKITEVLILNKEEAEELRDKSGLKGDSLFELNKLGPKIVVITDKDNPTRCLYKNKEYNITPHKNIKVVERTGAGDAFASGFVAGLIANYKVEDCLNLGLKESEAVIQHFGAKNDLIRKKIK